MSIQRSGIKGMSAAGGLATIALLVTNAPWWLAVLTILTGAACTVVPAVFPQESVHRLEWWRELWRASARHRRQHIHLQAQARYRPRGRRTPVEHQRPASTTTTLPARNDERSPASPELRPMSNPSRPAPVRAPKGR